MDKHYIYRQLSTDHQLPHCEHALLARDTSIPSQSKAIFDSSPTERLKTYPTPDPRISSDLSYPATEPTSTTALPFPSSDSSVITKPYPVCPPSPSLQTQQLSKSLPSLSSQQQLALRFPVPQGNQRLAQWLSHIDTSSISDSPRYTAQDRLTRSAITCVTHQRPTIRRQSEPAVMTKQARRKSSAKALAEQVDSLTGSAYVDIESVEDSPVADDSSQCSDDNATSDLDPEHEYVPHRDDILNAEETQQDTQIDQPTPDLGDDEDYDAIMAYDVGEDYLALNPSPTRFAGSCASSGASMSDATSVFIDCDDSEEELDETLDSHVPDDLTTPRGSIHQPGLVVSNLHILSDFEDSTAEQPKAEQAARKDSFKYIESSLGKPSTPQMSQILPPRKRIEGGNAFTLALTDFWGSLRELFMGIPGPREMWDDASPQAVGAVATLLTMLLLSTFVSLSTYQVSDMSPVGFHRSETVWPTHQQVQEIGVVSAPISTTTVVEYKTSVNYVYLTTTATATSTATTTVTSTVKASETVQSNPFENFFAKFRSFVKEDNKTTDSSRKYQSFQAASKTMKKWKDASMLFGKETLDKFTRTEKPDVKKLWEETARPKSREAVAKAKLGFVNLQIQLKEKWLRVIGKDELADEYREKGRGFLGKKGKVLEKWVHQV